MPASRLPVRIEELARRSGRSLAPCRRGWHRAGVRQSQLRLTNIRRAEAEAFMATVHSAMLEARAYGDPKIFGVAAGPLVERLASRTD